MTSNYPRVKNLPFEIVRVVIFYSVKMGITIVIYHIAIDVVFM